MLRALVLACLALLAVAGPARAARVRVVDADPRMGDQDLAYDAAPGEVNQVTIAGHAGGTIRVTDTTATLTAGAHCVAESAHAATCAPGAGHALTGVGADLGDRADRLLIKRGPGAPWTGVGVDGGAGDDHIALGQVRTRTDSELVYSVLVDGDAGDDTILGSPGRDAIGGGPGSDIIRAGAGADSLDGDGHEQVDGDAGFEHVFEDLLDGGPGRDVVSYAAHPRGVRVDLAHPRRAGAPGERDRLRSIEDVIGTEFSDVLLGDAGANDLDGWMFEDFSRPRGPDRLVGHGGDDILRGTPLADRFDAGTGRDRIDLDGGHDHTRCGSGRDTIVPDLTPLLQPRGCERLDDGSYTFGPFHVAAGHLRATLRQDGGGGAICHEELHLRSRDGATVYGDVGWGRHRPARLSVPLTRAGRAAHAAHRVALVRELGCTGSPSRWLVRL